MSVPDPKVMQLLLYKKLSHEFANAHKLLYRYILLSPHVFSMVESRELQIYGKIKNFEYAHQILDGNNIEPLISENHNRM